MGFKSCSRFLREDIADLAGSRWLARSRRSIKIALTITSVLQLRRSVLHYITDCLKIHFTQNGKRKGPKDPDLRLLSGACGVCCWSSRFRRVGGQLVQTTYAPEAILHDATLVSWFHHAWV